MAEIRKLPGMMPGGAGPSRHTARASALQRFAWMWGRESVLRLLLALVLAVALWLYITAKQDPTLAYDYGAPVPVATQNLGNNYVVTNDLGTVHVRIRVDNRNVPVTSASLHAFVNLFGLRAGFAPFVPVKVVADPGIHVVAITPSRVPVVLDTVSEKHVPVHWHIFASPPSGYAYKAGAIRVTPNTVTVSGPESIVGETKQAIVYVDLSQARSSVEGSYKPQPVNGQGAAVAGRQLALDPPQVHVSVPISALTSYKTLPVLARLKGNPKTGFGVQGVSVSPAEITAYGSSRSLSRVTSVSTSLLTIPSRASHSFSITSSLHLPKDLHSRTRRVTVHVNVSPVDSSSSVETAVTPINLGANLVVKTRPAKVLVTVVGPSSSVRAAARTMRAQIDLAGFGPGTYHFSPKIVVPAGLQQEGPVYPTSVSVVISSASP